MSYCCLICGTSTGTGCTDPPGYVYRMRGCTAPDGRITMGMRKKNRRSATGSGRSTTRLPGRNGIGSGKRCGGRVGTARSPPVPIIQTNIQNIQNPAWPPRHLSSLSPPHVPRELVHPGCSVPRRRPCMALSPMDLSSQTHSGPGSGNDPFNYGADGLMGPTMSPQTGRTGLAFV